MENPSAFGGPCDKCLESDPSYYNKPHGEFLADGKELFKFDGIYPSEDQFDKTEDVPLEA